VNAPTSHVEYYVSNPDLVARMEKGIALE